MKQLNGLAMRSYLPPFLRNEVGLWSQKYTPGNRNDVILANPSQHHAINLRK